MRTFALLSVVSLSLAAASACKSDPPAPSSVAPPVAAPIAPPVSGPVGEVLDAYDVMRTDLGNDDIAGAVAVAAKLAPAAHAAAAAAMTIPARLPLAHLADAADAMAKGPPSDASAARAAFSELSKHLVTVISADPALQTGRFLFLCPMARGYQKWVQTSPKLLNPFYGKAMPDCGELQKIWAV